MAKPKHVEVKASLTGQFKVESTVGSHQMIVDQPEGGGGSNQGPNPLEYFFLSLAGCIGTVGRILAKQKRIELRGIDMELKGELDLEKLMGISQASRAGFSGIEAHVSIDADLSDEEKAAFLREIDERCPISDNILNATPVSFRLKN